MNFRFLAVASLASLAIATATARADLRPFVPGSFKVIQQENTHQPFLLVMWGVDCEHCDEELTQLQGILSERPGLPIVLVATDTDGSAAPVSAYLERKGLAIANAWYFAANPDWLRYEVDRKWKGEVPRNYFFEAGRMVRAQSGKLDEAALREWAGKVQLKP